MSAKVLSAILTALLSMGGCATDFDCTQIQTYPIEIIPVDANSGLPIAEGVRATAAETGGRSSPFVGYRWDVAGHLLSLWGGDGPGVYRVTVQRPGFLTWYATNVRVEEAEGCQRFVPLALVVRMQPQ